MTKRCKISLDDLTAAGGKPSVMNKVTWLTVELPQKYEPKVIKHSSNQGPITRKRGRTQIPNFWRTTDLDKSEKGHDRSRH